MRTPIIVVAGVVLLASQVFAQQKTVPSDITSTLQANTDALKNLAFDWQLTQTTVNSAASPDEIERVRREAPERVRHEIQVNRGVTDEKLLNKFVDARVRTMLQTLQGYSVSYTSNWQWINNGNLASITGQTQNSKSLRISYNYYFSNEWGIFVNTDNFNPQNGEHIATDGPSVWANTKDSTYVPDTIAPYINVADAVFLMGYNPLKALALSWQWKSSNINAVVLSAQIKETDANPIDFKLTLDRLHGMLPSQLETVKGKYKTRYDVTEFEKYNNVWISKKVSYVRDFGNGSKSSFDWQLVKVKNSDPISVSIPANSIAVSDYRLLGKELNWQTVANGQLSSPKIVAYKWTGRLPTLEQLQKLQQKLHPGEATPDSKQASVLPFVGGLMMLVGGVWMFRRRGGSSS